MNALRHQACDWGKRYSIVLMCLLLPWLAGCSQPPAPLTGNVTGTVTYQGKPLSQGIVLLYCGDQGTGASFNIADDGTYHSTVPIPIGQYEVAVMPPEAAPPEDMTLDISPANFPEIPFRYRNTKKSGLSLDLQPGDNLLNIEMTAKK